MTTNIKSDEVMAIHNWETNGHLIADVAKLGYLQDPILDVTFGQGIFWRQWQPHDLTANDLESDHPDVQHRWDFLTEPPTEWLQRFRSVVYDPPYKLNGTHADQGLDRYGIAKPVTNNARLASIVNGASQAGRCVTSGGYLLVKCQAQVAGDKVRWQPRLVADRLETEAFRQVDEFHMVTRPRPQPPGRRQVHARRNHSTLLILQR